MDEHPLLTIDYQYRDYWYTVQSSEGGGYSVHVDDVGECGIAWNINEAKHMAEWLIDLDIERSSY